jgi:hypothetical protein
MLFDFYFIHNYKTSGTTIFNQLDNEYKKRYYGRMTFNDYINKNKDVNIIPNTIKNCTKYKNA